MKFLGPQIAYLLTQSQTRRNLTALAKLIALLLGLILVYALLFRFLKVTLEGENPSFITSVYWTLTVMSTLGFGDITFHHDIGRLFSIVVLISGFILLLVVLPFAFIRFFYAPWLEAQLRLRAPRRVPEGTSGHVIVCSYDAIGRNLVARLQGLGIPYHVIEPDVAAAAALNSDGIAAVTGEVDSRSTYEALETAKARMVVANVDDATNTNVTITVREGAPNVPVLAVVDDPDSVDILELAGATKVLPLKQLLGKQLASRVNAGHAKAYVVSSYRDLVIAEFPTHNTGLAGKTVRETRLRELTGLSIVAHWQQGRLVAARPDSLLSDNSVVVVIGTEEQVLGLDAMFVIYPPDENAVVVIGGGEVGRAAVVALKERGVRVHVVERDVAQAFALEGVADAVFTGDANERELLARAGIQQSPSVVLTTHDDATNIYLAVYCRRLSPSIRIISRVTHDRNVEAIHRAGANFVLSYSSLGARTIISELQERDVALLGEGVDLLEAPVPPSLEGRTLAESQIGAKTGLNVIALRTNDHVVTNPRAHAALMAGTELVMIGSIEQLKTFDQTFGRRKRSS